MTPDVWQTAGTFFSHARQAACSHLISRWSVWFVAMAVHHLLFATAYIGLILSIWVFIAKQMDLKLAATLEFLRGVIIKAVALLLALGWAASIIR